MRKGHRVVKIKLNISMKGGEKLEAIAKRILIDGLETLDAGNLADLSWSLYETFDHIITDLQAAALSNKPRLEFLLVELLRYEAER